MKRRNLLMLAGTAATSTLALGTGAFNVSRADRTINVGVEEDYDAYLQLEDLGTGERSELDGGVLKLNIPGEEESDYNDQNPEGLGTDSVYWFSKDTQGDVEGLFKLTNQGTDPVQVYSTQSNTSDVPSVTMFDVDGQDLLTEDDPSDKLGVGKSIRCGIRIDTNGVEIREEAYEITLTINAIASD